MNKWRDTLLAQYANSPILRALIESMNGALDPRVNLDAFYDQVWNISTATGHGLDVWGRIIGISRELEIPQVIDYFGFQTGGTPEHSLPFNVGVFYPGFAATQSYDLTDDAYRTLLLFKAFANIAATDIPTLNRLANLLFPYGGSFAGGVGRAWVEDMGGMEMQYHFRNDLNAYQLAIINKPGLLPHPTGVGVTVFHDAGVWVSTQPVNGTAVPAGAASYFTSLISGFTYGLGSAGGAGWPVGITINPTTGVITGTAVGTFTGLTLTATLPSGTIISTNAFTLTLAAPYSYPAASTFPVLFRFDGTDGAATAANSGTLGGSLTFSASQRITTAASKYGSGSLKALRVASLYDGGELASASLHVPDGGLLTFGGWLQVNGAGDDHVLQYYLDATSFVYFFSWPGAGGPEIRLNASGGAFTGITIVFSTLAVTAGTWHYVEATIDGTTLRMFVDGVFALSRTMTSSRIGTSGKLNVGLQQTPGSSAAPADYTLYDNVFAIPGVCAHTAAFTPPGDFT